MAEKQVTSKTTKVKATASKAVAKKPATKVLAAPKTATKKATSVAKEEVKATVEKTAQKTRTEGISVTVFDKTGKKGTTIMLPKEIFGAKINPSLMSQAVRVYLANQRQGNASTKTRGEVTGSTRKIYRQKGTGRARHGSNRAPIFVHGGIAHGPHPRDYSLTLPQNMRKAALFSALSAQLKDAKVLVIEGISDITPKTKEMTAILKNMDVAKKGILLVLPAKTANVERAARNIEGVEIMLAQQLNTYEVLKARTVIFMHDAIDVLEKHFLKA